MKKLLLLLMLVIAPIFKATSAPVPVFIHHSSEQTDYITITPKGDTMYVYNKEIVSKDIYDKRVKEEKIMLAKIIAWFILLLIALVLNAILIALSVNFDNNILLHLTTGSLLVFSIFYLVLWPIICVFTTWEWGITF